jgi:heme/copper-type cytochrome/quinol oxidase subunit 2
MFSSERILVKSQQIEVDSHFLCFSFVCFVLFVVVVVVFFLVCVCQPCRALFGDAYISKMFSSERIGGKEQSTEVDSHNVFCFYFVC